MKQKIRTLIAAGETEKALALLAEHSNDALLLQGRYASLARQQRLGLLDHKEFSLELNKINHSLLELLERTNFELHPTPPTNNPEVNPGPTTNNKKSVFISYAHEDKDLQQRLRSHLATLRRSEKISDWSDQELLPGEAWEDKIVGKLRSADIILLLVSNDFINSDFIWENELPIALERHKRGEAIVVPVILRPCQWMELPIGRLQGLPAGAKPVTDWPNQDQAFLSIAEGIKKLI